VNLEAEGALQFGHSGPDRHFGCAALAECSYVFPTPWEPRLSADVCYASGDPDGTDGVSNTFRSPFPGDLRRLTGLLELVGLRNSYALGLGGSIGPVEGLRVGGSVRWLGLARAGAGWYDGSGEERTVAISGKELGREIDVFGRYRFTTLSGKDCRIEGGYALLEPGGALPVGTGIVQSVFAQVAFRF
jgi:hypothetical protein